MMEAVPLIIFSIPAALPTLCYEFLLSGLAIERMGLVRIIYGAIRLLGAPYCNRWTDAARIRLSGMSRSRFCGALADAVALSTYQVPLYIAVALPLGAAPRQVVFACGLAVIGDFCFGWFYRWMRNRVRPGAGTVRRMRDP